MLKHPRRGKTDGFLHPSFSFKASATKLLGAFIVTLGAIASYFRFFKGRMLSLRLKIDATVEVFPIDSSRTLHVLSVEVINVGSVRFGD